MPFTRNVVMNSQRDVVETILTVPKLERTCFDDKKTLLYQPDSEVVPAGAKLPLIPGSHLHLFTRELGQRLYHDPCEFDRSLPPDIYIGTDYRCFNDHRLRKFFYNRESLVEKLKEQTLLTRENKVVCSLKEYNSFRGYLKYLQIQNLNRMMRNQYIKHSTQTKIAIKAEKEKRRQDPKNPINAKLKRAKDARDAMDRVRKIKGKKILKKAAEDRERMILEKKAAEERKTIGEIRREKERENKIQNKSLRMHKDELMKKELMNFKYEEDEFLQKQLDEKRRIQELEMQRNQSLRLERLKRFKLMKMAENRQLWEQETNFRQHDIEVWKNYFQTRITLHEEKVKRAIEEYRRSRMEKNKRILDDLEKRGWNALRHYNPEAYRKQLAENQSLFGRITLSHIKSSKFDFRGGDATLESARRYLEQFSSSQWLVHKAIDISKAVMLPLFRAYEERNNISHQNSEIPNLLKHLYSDGLKEITKSSRKKTRTYLSPTDVPTINVDEDMTESQFLIEQTVQELSRRVASHVTHRHATAKKLASLQDSIAIRINQLANAVIVEILKFSSAAVSRVSASPSSAGSRVSSSVSQISIEKKLSLLSKIMIDEVFGGRKHVNFLDADHKRVSEQMNSLAYYIAHSAIHTAALAETEGFANSRDFYNKIAPMVEDLSYKIVGEIMKERIEQSHKDEKGLEKFEKKISDLAITIVQSVLVGKDVSTTYSDENALSKTTATNVVGASFNKILEGITSYKTKKDHDQSLVQPFNENDLKSISLKVAKKSNVSRDKSLLSAIHVLTTALAEDAFAQIINEGKPVQMLFTQDALKGLAEALVIVKEDQSSTSPRSSYSAMSSAISELAENLVKATLKIDKISAGASPRETSSAISSAISELAEYVVKSTFKGDKFVASSSPQNTASAMNLAMNELAQQIVKSALKTDKVSPASLRQKTASTISELAEQVVKSALSTRIRYASMPEKWRY